MHAANFDQLRMRIYWRMTEQVVQPFRILGVDFRLDHEISCFIIGIDGGMEPEWVAPENRAVRAAANREGWALKMNRRVAVAAEDAVALSIGDSGHLASLL